MFKHKNSKVTVEDIGNVPQTAYEKGKAVWAEQMGGAVVNQGRLFVITIMSIFAVACMALALSGLAPLKTVVPYSIHVDKVTGETRAVGITASAYTPNDQQKKYHVAKWVKQLMALDPFTTEKDLSEAYSIVRGKAIEEFRDYLAKTQPIARLRADTSLTRTVKPSTIQFLADNIAQVRVQTQTRSTKNPEETKNYAVLLHFAIETPQTDQEILRNPIGLFVTHFSISEELL